MINAEKAVPELVMELTVSNVYNHLEEMKTPPVCVSGGVEANSSWLFLYSFNQFAFWRFDWFGRCRRLDELISFCRGNN